MKTKLFFLVIIFMISNEIYCQKLSISTEIGYGFQLNPTSIPDGSYKEIDELLVEGTSVIHSYGEGINYGIFIDYLIHPNIEIGIGLSYLKGRTKDIIFIALNEQDIIKSTHSSMLRIIPEIKLKQPIFKNNIFFRLGFIIGVKNEIIVDYNSNDNAILTKTKYFEGISYGLMSGIGYEFKINKNIFITPEIRGFYQSYSPNRSKRVIYRVNGENKLESLEEWYKNSYFVDEFEEEETGTNYSKPSTELRRYYPFSSIGLNLSLTYKM